MGLDKEHLAAGRQSRARQGRHKLRVAAGRIARRDPVDADGMGRIDDHRITEAAHDRQAAIVDNQIVIAEKGAALGEHDVLVALALDLGDDVFHVGRIEELPLLDIDRPAGARRGEGERSLHREIGRDLDDVKNFTGDDRLMLVVDIRQHRHTQLEAHLFEDAQPLVEAEALEGGSRGTVVLGIGGFQNVGHPEPVGDLLHRFCRAQHQGLALDHAGSGDEGQRLVRADGDGTHLNRLHAESPSGRRISYSACRRGRPRRTPGRGDERRAPGF